MLYIPHEEVMLFPFLSEKLDMSGEIEQHKIIHACLEKLFAFIGAAQADPSQFDAVKMGAILTTLKDPLVRAPHPEARRIWHR